MFNVTESRLLFQVVQIQSVDVSGDYATVESAIRKVSVGVVLFMEVYFGVRFYPVERGLPRAGLCQ